MLASGSFTAASTNLTGLADIASYVWGLVTLVPSLALSARRLHDSNRSGWWLLIVLVPVVGAIVLLVFYLAPPDPRGARYDRGSALR